MDKNYLWKKLEQERKLSNAEWETLEKQDDPEIQKLISLYVRSIYEEPPPPSWQNRLMERLRQRKPRRAPLRLALPLAAGGALALWMLILLTPHPHTISKEELANQLTQWHEEAKVVTFLPPDSKDLASLPSKMPNTGPNEVEELVFGDYLKEL